MVLPPSWRLPNWHRSVPIPAGRFRCREPDRASGGVGQVVMAATWMIDAVPAATCGAALKGNKLSYQAIVVQKIDGAAAD